MTTKSTKATGAGAKAKAKAKAKTRAKRATESNASQATEISSSPAGSRSSSQAKTKAKAQAQAQAKARSQGGLASSSTVSSSLPPLTPRQQQVLDIITASLRHTSVFPSLRDIARKLGVSSPSGVAGHLKALAAKGYLARTQTPLQTSGFVLPPLEGSPSSAKQQSNLALEQSNESEGGRSERKEQGFPLVAQIAAGSPHEAYTQYQQDTLFFSYDYFGGGDLKAMSVEGQSMLGDAIDDGDIVIVNTKMTSLQPLALNPSHIVAVRVMGGEFSLKRLAVVGDQIKLIPSNPDYSPRLYPKDQVEILGVMVGLVRRF